MFPGSRDYHRPGHEREALPLMLVRCPRPLLRLAYRGQWDRRSMSVKKVISIPHSPEEAEKVLNETKVAEQTLLVKSSLPQLVKESLTTGALMGGFTFLACQGVDLACSSSLNYHLLSTGASAALGIASASVRFANIFVANKVIEERMIAAPIIGLCNATGANSLDKTLDDVNNSKQLSTVKGVSRFFLPVIEPIFGDLSQITDSVKKEFEDTDKG